MSHVLALKAQYFRALFAEVARDDDPAKRGFVAWLRIRHSSTSKRSPAAAEKSSEITKIGITSNESPQYLTMWQRK